MQGLTILPGQMQTRSRDGYKIKMACPRNLGNGRRADDVGRLRYLLRAKRGGLALGIVLGHFGSMRLHTCRVGDRVFVFCFYENNRRNN